MKKTCSNNGKGTQSNSGHFLKVESIGHADEFSVEYKKKKDKNN